MVGAGLVVFRAGRWDVVFVEYLGEPYFCEKCRFGVGDQVSPKKRSSTNKLELGPEKKDDAF